MRKPAPKNRNRRWGAKGDAAVLKMYKVGRSWDYMAAKLGRTREAVKQHYLVLTEAERVKKPLKPIIPTTFRYPAATLEWSRQRVSYAREYGGAAVPRGELLEALLILETVGKPL